MAPEKLTQAPKLPDAPEAPSKGVSQPAKISALNDKLGMFLEDVGRISENAKEGPSEQFSTSTGGAVATQTSGSTGMSARDQAIANIPTTAVMQKELKKHIQAEVKKLRKQAKEVARINQPGKAYRLNQLYARIRQLNSLLGELLGSSYEVVKRLFIKVFIDRQAIL